MKSVLLFTTILISLFCKAQDYNWTIYNTTNSPLSCDGVSALAVANDSSIWLASCNEIYKYKNGNWTIYDSAIIGSSINVRQITIDNNNIKWFGTAEGLLKYDDNTWTIYNTANSNIPANYIGVVVADHDNLIWFYSPDATGFYTFDGTNFNVYNQDSSEVLAISGASRIAVDSENNKWFAGYGLYKYDNSEWTHETIFIDNNNQVGSLRSIDLDTNDDRWLSLGPFHNRLRVYPEDGSSYQDYNQANTSIPMQGNTRVAFDSIGNVWAGGISGRLIRFDRTNWYEYNPSNSPFPTELGGPLGAQVADIVVGPENIVYVAIAGTDTDAGLIKIEYSPIGISEIISDHLTIFPNPVENFLNLNIDITGKLLIQIIDTKGLEFYTIKQIDLRANDNGKINVDNLASGVYYLKIEGENITEYKMFIKK